MKEIHSEKLIYVQLHGAVIVAWVQSHEQFLNDLAESLPAGCEGSTGVVTMADRCEYDNQTVVSYTQFNSVP